MIIRSLAARQGRNALAAPSIRPCLRTLSTDTAPTSGPPIDSSSSTAPSTANAVSAGPKAYKAPGASWGKAAVRDTTVPDFIARQRLRQKTSRIGSAIEGAYDPEDLVFNPPGPKDITLELLMASQTHMGHHESLWNPANARYIYGIRAGIHIISLEATAAHLRRAARVVEEMAYLGGLTLFVGNRKGQTAITTGAARLAGACHLFSKWTPGTITNRDLILAKAAIQVVDEHDKPRGEFNEMFHRPLVPDLVVVLNPMENFTLLHECAVMNIPTIGVIDTNADPTRVTYAIPANDDSLRSVALIAGVLGRAGQLGQTRRKKAAEDGVITWRNPAEVSRYLFKMARQDQMEAELEHEPRKDLYKTIEDGMQQSTEDGGQQQLEDGTPQRAKGGKLQKGATSMQDFEKELQMWVDSLEVAGKKHLEEGGDPSDIVKAITRKNEEVERQRRRIALRMKGSAASPLQK